MTFAAAGGLIEASATTFSLTPGGTGDLILLEVINFGSTTVWCTSLTSSNVTWVQIGNEYTGNSATAVVFAGTVTSTSAQTVTLAFNGTPTSIFADGQEFSSTAGGWAIDGAQGNWTVATNTWPSLTPSAAGGLYFGHAYDGASAIAGSTSGYVYAVDSHTNGMAYNVSCASGVATAPVWADSNHQMGIVVLMKETAAVAIKPSIIQDLSQSVMTAATR